MIVKRFLIIALVAAMLVLIPGCSKDDDSRNPNYTYGTYQNESELDATYGFVGAAKTVYPADYMDWGSASGRIYSAKISETSSGGIIIYGEGVFVYSPVRTNETGFGGVSTDELALSTAFVSLIADE